MSKTFRIFRLIIVCCFFIIPLNSQACHLVTITETNAVDNGDGTYTYTFDICTGIEDTYGFFLTFTGANLISYPASVTGPSSGNTINASVPPTSGSGDIEYGNWDSNAGTIYSSAPTNDCVSMSFTFDGSISQADIGGTQAFYAGGPCAGSLSATTCFASSATYQISITASNSNNQSYSFGLDGVFLGSGPTNGQTDTYLICGCASTFTVTASGGGSIPSWTVTQLGVGTAGSGTSEVVNSALTPCVTTLPIELIDFKASYEQENVSLKWSTSSERDNDYFTIERSNGNQEWTVVDKVTGAGTTTELTEYELLDSEYELGNNYYRLKQTDFNGTSTYSSVKALNVERSNMSQVYPNPFTSSFNLEIVLDQEQTSELSVVDASGRVYYKENIQFEKGINNFEVLTSDLEDGVYHLKIELDDSVILHKIIKH